MQALFDHELQAGAHDESQRRLEREQDKLAAYCDYREQAAADRLASSHGRGSQTHGDSAGQRSWRADERGGANDQLLG